MSPALAVEGWAAYLAKRVDELKANDVPEERLMPWVGAVQKAFNERLEQLAGPEYQGCGLGRRSGCYVVNISQARR